MVSPVDLVKRGGNRAVEINGTTGVDIHITSDGSDWLFTAFSAFGLFLVIYLGCFFMATRKNKKLAVYALAPAIAITFVEFFAYFTWASNLGWAPVRAEFNTVSVDPSVSGLTPGLRQIFYLKYVAWFLTWPNLLFLIELAGVTTGHPDLDPSALDIIHSLLLQVFGTSFWIVSLLVGMLIQSTYKFGYFSMGACGMLVVQALLIHRNLYVHKIRGLSAFLFLIFLVTMWGYFLCWALSEGGNVMQPDSEAIFDGILDVCIFLIYTAYLVLIICDAGRIPNISMKSTFHIRKAAEPDYEKEPDGASPRNSGETNVSNPSIVDE